MRHLCSNYFCFRSIELRPNALFSPLDKSGPPIVSRTLHSGLATSFGETGVSPVNPTERTAFTCSPARKRYLYRGAGHKRRPVDAALEFIVRRKDMFERKRKLRRPMGVEMRDPLSRFVNSRQMSRRNPPQREIAALELFEPLFAMTQKLCMRRAIHVMLERFHRIPDRHVDQNRIVVLVRPQVSCIALGRLQTPHETRTALCERVDLIQSRHETRHARIVRRIAHAADVHFRNVVCRHGVPPPVTADTSTRSAVVFR